MAATLPWAIATRGRTEQKSKETKYFRLVPARFYCLQCDEAREYIIDLLEATEKDPEVAEDIVCKHCGYIAGTFHQRVPANAPLLS